MSGSATVWEIRKEWTKKPNNYTKPVKTYSSREKAYRKAIRWNQEHDYDREMPELEEKLDEMSLEALIAYHEESISQWKDENPEYDDLFIYRDVDPEDTERYHCSKYDYSDEEY